MGWKLKAALVLLALGFLAATIWQLSLLIFAALIIPALARRSSRGTDGRPGKAKRFPFRWAGALALILLSLVAFLEGGTISPVFFGGTGLLLLAWGHVPGFSVGGSLKPVKDSVLLRTSLNPFGWTAIAEVKPVTRDLGKALSGIGAPMIVTATGTPAIRIALRTTALSERSAGEALLGEMEKLNRGIVPLGAYLLPLDSAQAAEVFREPLQPDSLSEDRWALALSTGAYDVLSVEPDDGFAQSLGLYSRSRGQEAANPTVPRPSRRFDHPPLLWEVFKSLETRVQWPNPDRYTAFLSSIYAASDEPIGSNIIDAGTLSPISEGVVVRSHSSPAVELSRAQLRAIMKVYSQGPPVVRHEPRVARDTAAFKVPEPVPEEIQEPMNSQ